MKYLIVSDIHGSLPQLEKVLDYFEREEMDMLLILGDILNYGPRNGVPEGLDPQAIAARLNALADKIIAVRGNCDSEVDQMLLKFPIHSDYAFLVDEGVKLFLTHGHIYNKENMPTLNTDILLYGHTHRQELTHVGRALVCNTGSITFPKDGNPPTFATYSQGHLRLHHLDGSLLAEEIIKIR